MSKHDKTIFKIAKRARGLGQRLRKFFFYRLLVNAKHFLIVGDTTSPVALQLIKNLKSTWRIAALDQNDNTHVDLSLKYGHNALLNLDKTAAELNAALNPTSIGSKEEGSVLNSKQGEDGASSTQKDVNVTSDNSMNTTQNSSLDISQNSALSTTQDSNSIKFKQLEEQINAFSKH